MCITSIWKSLNGLNKRNKQLQFYVFLPVNIDKETKSEHTTIAFNSEV
jgi:hypothetical protein